MQNFVWMDEQESEGHGRRWCRGAEASGPSWRHTPAEPSSGHSSWTPFLPTAPFFLPSSWYQKDLRRIDGPGGLREVVNPSSKQSSGYHGLALLEVWLCVWFILTFPAGSRLRLRFQPAACLPACNPNLYTHCFHTEGCPSPLSPDTFREGESAHLGCWWGCSALSTWIWLCHCLAPKASLSRIHHVTCGQMACSSRMGTVSPPSCTALWGTGPSSVPVGFRVGHSANSQRAPGLSLYPRTAGEPGIFSPPSDACARYLSSQQIPAHSWSCLTTVL